MASNKPVKQHGADAVRKTDIILPNQAGVRALFQRNHAMVDMSDMVIALYENDAWPYTKGGTAECMRYTASHSKQLLQIRYETESGQLTLKGLERIR